MAGDKETFMGPLGRPCTVYVERGDAPEEIAQLQELTIKAAGGIVTKEADEAAVIVVIKRTESIEQRIRDTCYYKTTDPVTQAEKSELQGPPDWGGHLLCPKEPSITRDKAKEVAFAIFGHLRDVPEQEAVAGEADAMQIDPAPAAGSSGANSRDDTQEEESRGRRMTGSNNNEWRSLSPVSLAWQEVNNIIDDPDEAGVFRTFTIKDMKILVRELYEVEADTELAQGWWKAFTARRAAVTPEAQRHSLDSWREFYRNRSKVVNKCVNILLSAKAGPGINLRPLRDHSATTTSRYRNRSRSGGRNSNRGSRGSGEQAPGTTPGALASEPSSIPSGTKPPGQGRRPVGRPRKKPVSEQGQLPQTPLQANKNGTVGRPQRSSSRIRSASGAQVASAGTLDHHGAVEVSQYSDSDALNAMKFFSSYGDSELLNQEHTIPPGRKAAFDAFMRGRIVADPTRSPGSEGGTWTNWLKNNWDIISTGALALNGKTGTGAQKSLSNRDQDFTAADYDEMADFIANLIQARKVVKGSETAVLMQGFVWKAFALVYQTNRDWNEWQEYYREKAEKINQTARVRLRPEDVQVAQVAAQMEQLHANGMYYSPPPSAAMKRPLEGPSDEQRSKQPRL
ncbi:hypothetical protein M407DRAFT_24228 [Tulasnella calospora MUT 4182]|uniref:Uncharacterized protein n=1 Tax=Tulasnella calospora MUT 4182 TaxID=1051891 RepID=A0A0C3LYI6_9AGAM|nr:hypothetical protein M407DRAFT_24228 [Tulasnella calospora MUT 4182]